MVYSSKQLIVDAREKKTATEFFLQLYTNLIDINEAAQGEKVFDRHNFKLIILYLYEYVERSYRESNKRTGLETSNYERILDRGIRFLYEEGGRSCSLEKLSKEIFASKRSVQYAFSRLIGMPPTQFCKLLRLNFIRNELLSDNEQDLSINALLKKYHISNPSRFKREYSEFFKEHPEFSQAA